MDVPVGGDTASVTDQIDRAVLALLGLRDAIGVYGNGDARTLLAEDAAVLAVNRAYQAGVTSEELLAARRAADD